MEATLKETKENVDNKAELVELLKSLQEIPHNSTQGKKSPKELEAKLVENFSHWVGKSKIGIGYLLYR